MRRRLWWPVVVLLAVLALSLPPVVASAPSTLQVTDTGVIAQFPGSLQFTVSAESPNPVVDVRLLYQIEKMNFATVTSEAWASFQPDTAVSTSWTWDMRLSSLPPGARITYWWRARDASGAVVETSPATVLFDDDRYDWRSIKSDNVTLHWYYGDDDFAGELMQVCETAIESLAQDVGARVDRRISVYLYKSSADLRQAMVYPQEWTGGVAFTDYGIVAIGIGPGDMEWGIRALRHELAHLVVHTLTFSPYGGLPTWLDEGLAMHNEGEAADTFVTVLRQAVADDALISLRSLNGPFSSDTQKAYLSYAQSHSVVSYLLASYGAGPMGELLALLTEGETVDDALTLSYGMSLDGVEAEWKAAVREVMAYA
ncbi:MAG: peptidase MA domain-containing protein [Dehalococcoidia bacterium]|nr:peptidase MA domain-containing protein [Dehalococcoidia bacterium]